MAQEADDRTYTYYKLLWGGGVYGLLRVHLGRIERWQPVAKEWISAPWNAEQIWEPDHYDKAEMISAVEAEAIQSSNIIENDLPEEAIRLLMSGH